jgi:hypothetical protein
MKAVTTTQESQPTDAPASDDPGAAPLVMVVGRGRSGTTWLGKIFDSHPDTLYCHEPDTWEQIPGVPLFEDSEKYEQYAPAIREFVTGLLRARDPRVTAKLPIFPKNYYSSLRYRLRQFYIGASKFGSRFKQRWSVPPLFDPRQNPDVRIVWKSVNSTGRLGLVHRSVPNCRTIVILRHPCGHAASWLRGKEGKHFMSAKKPGGKHGHLAQLLEMPHAKARGLTLEAVSEMHPLEQRTWLWALSNEKMLLEAKDEPNCTCIRYEDLCADPEGVSRQLFERAGLAWHPQTEAFVRQSTTTENDNYYSVYKNPAASANKWRTELADEDVKRILAVVQGSLPGEYYPPE